MTTRPIALAGVLLAAACTLAMPAAAQSGGGATPDAATVRVAEQRYLSGQQRFLARDYAGALADCRASLALYPSPNARLYVARALRELGRVGEAVAEFERTVIDATNRARTDARYAATRDAAAEEFATLRAQLGTLTVRVAPAPPRLRVLIAGQAVAPSSLGQPQYVRAGTVVVEVSAPGYATLRQQLEIEPGASETVVLGLARPAHDGSAARPTGAVGATGTATLAPQPPTTPPPPPPPRGVSGGAVMLGVGVAFTVLGVGFASALWLAAVGQYRDVMMLCGVDGPCPAMYQSNVDMGEALETGAYVSLAVGIAGAAVGTVGAVWLGTDAARRRPRAAARVTVRPIAWGTGAGIAGTFE